MKQFGAESIKAAVKYLDDGSTCWVRVKSCVNCHTTGPYLSERPALIPQLGKPSEEIVADFIEFVPKEVKEVKETATKSGYKHMPGAFSAVWRSLGLAEWDKHLSGKTSEHTERSIRDMFERQAASGAFVSHGEVEIPHITTDFELSLQAVRTITAAPGWLAGLKDEKLLGKVEKLKTWLRSAEPKNDWDRVLSLQLAFYMPELVSAEKRDAALKLLSSKQHADGGWSTRDFSALNDWHFEVSETVQKLITSLPDASKPESDAYMTALAVVLMRQSDVPAQDERLQEAVAWLKKEQRVSGRWWMHSLYRGMVLSGVMVKMSVFGVIRWLFPIVSGASFQWGDFITPLAIIGMIYASLIALRQDDLKRLVAYSSIAHISLLCAGLFTQITSGVQGVMIQMFSHGINIIGLWIVVEWIERNTSTRKMSELGGLAQTAPALAIFFVIIALADIALPLTNAFVGEFLIFNGILSSYTQYYVWFTAMAGICIILAAAYTLRMVRKVAYGHVNEITAKVTDIRFNEKLALGIIVVLIFWMGVFPQPMLDLTNGVTESIVNKFEVIRYPAVPK